MTPIPCNASRGTKRTGRRGRPLRAAATVLVALVTVLSVVGAPIGLAGAPVGVASADHGDGHATATATLVDEPSFDGVDVMKTVGGQEMQVVTHGGESGWSSEKSFYVDVADDFAFQEDVAITVRYYDGDAGKLHLQYKTESGDLTAAAHVQTEGSGEWKEETLITSNERLFANSLGGGQDFKFLVNGGSVTVSEIRFTSPAPESAEQNMDAAGGGGGGGGGAGGGDPATREYGPLTVEQTQIGNVFVGDETPEIALSGDVDDVAYAAVAYDGRTVDSGSVAIDGETTLSIPVERYGHYRLLMWAREGGNTVASANTTFASIPPLGYVADVEDSYFGMQAHFGFNWKPPVQTLMRLSGTKSYRDGFRWDSVEETRGEYTFPDKYDAHVGRAKEEGLNPLPLISYGNELYWESDDTHDPPSDDEARRAYARYANRVIDRYDPKYVNLWNEWNLHNIRNNDDPRAAGYADLVTTAYPLIKQEHPDVKIVGGAGASTYFVDHDQLQWYRDVYEAGGLEGMDAVSFHPYRHQWSPENPTQNGYDTGSIEEEMRRMRDLTAEFNDGEEKPIWTTEMGYTAADPWKEATGGPDDADIYTHAQYAVRKYVMGKAGGAEKAHWYTFQDRPGNYAGFGIVRTRDDPTGRYVPKPAFSTYSALTRQLTNTELASKDGLDGNAFGYVFEGEGERTRLLWLDHGSPDVDVQADQVRMATLQASGPVRVTDPMGNEQTYQPHDGAVYLPVSEDPIYVEGPVSDVSMGAPVSLSAPSGTQDESIPVTVTTDGGLSGELAFRGTSGRVSLPDGETTVDVAGSTYAELRTIHADVVVDGKRVGHVQASSVVKGDEYPRESAGPPGSSASGATGGDARSDGGAGDGGQDANDGAGGDGGADAGGDAGDGDSGVGAPGFGALAALAGLLGAVLLARRRR